MRLGIFLPNWIGDVVMATPALRALRKWAGPDAYLVGVMRPYVAEVLKGSTWLDKTIRYAKRRDRVGLWGSKIVNRLREERLDTIVLMPNSLRTAWIAWRSGARERIGYAGNLRGGLLTTRMFEPRRGWKKASLPTIDSYLNLAYVVGCEPEPPRLELATTVEDEQQADSVWERLRLPEGDRVVVLNSGAAYGGAKDWPVEHFAALARRIAQNHGLSVLVNCGPGEREAARKIAQLSYDSRVVSLADEEDLPIGLSKSVIRRSRLLVTTDSGPRFFGVAFGRPVVTLFGPTEARFTKTHYTEETCLELDMDCRPCMQRTCPLGHHRCMKNLPVEMVYEEVAKHLSAERPCVTAA